MSSTGNIILLVIAGLIGLFIWKYIINPYIEFFFYWKQGIAYLGFPLPVIGNLKRIKGIMDDKSIKEKAHTFLKIHDHVFDGRPPKIFMEFRGPNVILNISDCKLLDDLYITKNKYFDKEGKMKNLLYDILGDTMVLDKSNEMWAAKRKSLSTAFYKEKMLKMLATVIELSLKRTEQWNKKLNSSGQVSVDLVEEIYEHVMTAMDSCIFGI